MTLIPWLVAAILGLVEGLTEFIPVSSTGHLILASDLFKFERMMGDPDKAEMFIVVIQLGAILAVGVYFRVRLFKTLFADSATSKRGKLRKNLLIAFLPAVVVGFLLHKWITLYLFSPVTVAVSLIAGGLIILIVERRSDGEKRKTPLESITTRQALMVGLAQITSLIPGVSRAGSTIIGGMLTGLTRPAATEFSFLLSFPIMIAASAYELMKHGDKLTSDMLSLTAIGFVSAFISALVVVAWLIQFVQRHSFNGFGIYRIVFGVLVLVLYSSHLFS